MLRNAQRSPRVFLRRLILAVGLTLVLVSPAQADLDAYLTLTLNGSQITGGVVSAGREGTIRVRALSFTGFAPVNPNGTSGAEQSRPITFLMDVDRSSPDLLAAWANNALVNQAIFRLYQPNQFGSEVNYLTLTLSGGRVSSYSLSSPDSLDPDLVSRPATILVGFTYATAELVHEPTGNTQVITWQAGQ
jgi:type VI secretion system Hcp family effector